MLNTLLMNTLGPFVVWKGTKLNAGAPLRQISDEECMAEMPDDLIQAAHGFDQLRFRSIGSAVLEAPDCDTFCRLFWHDDLKIVAVCMSANNGTEQLGYVEFSQYFSDGTTLEVSNNPLPQPYTVPIKTNYRFPKLMDPADLLAIFLRLRTQYEKNAKRVDFDVENGLEVIQQHMAEESNALLEKGFVKPDIDENHMRALTFYGALCLTYRSVAPWRNLIGYLSERKSQKALQVA
uniref:hypothetical protein n=1 Tax=Thaumasiovibrio occultus TaxID=1891184 RepID=UPI00131C50B7|nr:hypothetical protein [Thaumasiovibrio occultus]